MSNSISYLVTELQNLCSVNWYYIANIKHTMNLPTDLLPSHDNPGLIIMWKYINYV